VFMEVEAMRNVVGDPRELGNCRMLFPKTKPCSSGMRCSWLTKDVRRLAIIRSNSFPVMLRRLIGL